MPCLGFEPRLATYRAIGVLVLVVPIWAPQRHVTNVSCSDAAAVSCAS